MATALDYLAHSQDRHTRELIRKLMQDTVDIQQSMASIVDSVSPTSVAVPGTTGSDESSTTGIDYSTLPPTAGTLYNSMGERINSLDTYVGIPFITHDHNGINSPTIKPSAIYIPSALTGDITIVTLEDLIVRWLAKSRSVYTGFVVRDIPMTSVSALPYGDEDIDVSNIHGVIALSDGWTTVDGTNWGIQNIRTASSGAIFDVTSHAWRNREILPTFRIDMTNKIVEYNIATKWRHVSSPNIAGSEDPINLLVDMAVTVFGT